MRIQDISWTLSLKVFLRKLNAVEGLTLECPTLVLERQKHKTLERPTLVLERHRIFQNWKIFS
jgi:hypothetical protein